jgi:hypothetical protein
VSALTLFHSAVKGRRIIPVLKALGIPYRKRRRTIRSRYGYSFWTENEAELDYIYRDIMKKLRALMLPLHPDRENGSHERFVELNQTAQWVTKVFAQHGIGHIDRVAEANAKDEAEYKRRQRWSNLRKNK